MSTEIRMVPADWKHPVDSKGRYIPLRDGTNFQLKYDAWQEAREQWERGFKSTYVSLDTPAVKWVPRSPEDAKFSFEQYSGPCPDPKDYAPQFTREEATHFQAYENSSDGTPVSEVCATREELAHRMTVDTPFTDGSDEAYEREYALWMSMRIVSFEEKMSEEQRLKEILFAEAGLSLTKIRRALRTPEVAAALRAELDNQLHL